MIDPTFSKVYRLLVISFESEGDRNSFSKYYTPTVEIKDFNVLVNPNAFFDIFIRNKEEAYEEIIEMSRNNDYTTGNLLDYEYFSKHYKLIAIDLSKQVEFENPDVKQQSLREMKVQQRSLLLRKKKKPLLISHKIL